MQRTVWEELEMTNFDSGLVQRQRDRAYITLLRMAPAKKQNMLQNVAQACRIRSESKKNLPVDYVTLIA